MYDFLVGYLFLGVFVFIAAFLGSLLAFKIAGRPSATPPLAEDAPIEEAQATPEPEPKSPPATPAPIKRAFDFDDDQVTMILEMPAAMLEDDQALADGWVEVVDWARMAWQDVQQGKVDGDQLYGEGARALDESEITREHLQGSLQRLHDAAERRRQLRLKMAKG